MFLLCPESGHILILMIRIIVLCVQNLDTPMSKIWTHLCLKSGHSMSNIWTLLKTLDYVSRGALDSVGMEI